MHICRYECIHTYTCTCILNAFVQVYMYTYTHMYLCVYIHISMRATTHVYAHSDGRTLGADLGVEAVVSDEPNVLDGVVLVHASVSATWQQLCGRHLAEVGVFDHEEQTQICHVTFVMLHRSRQKSTKVNASRRKSTQVNASQRKSMRVNESHCKSRKVKESQGKESQQE